MKTQNDANEKRTKKPITVERIFDILMDIRIRARRGDSTSISQILKDNGFDQGLSLAMAEANFIEKEGRDYKYNLAQVTIELAAKVMEFYLERKRPVVTARVQPLGLFPEIAGVEMAESKTDEVLRLLRVNALTLSEVNKRLTRLETKVHSQGETLSQAYESKVLALKPTTFDNDSMQIVKTDN